MLTVVIMTSLGVFTALFVEPGNVKCRVFQAAATSHLPFCSDCYSFQQDSTGPSSSFVAYSQPVTVMP